MVKNRKAYYKNLRRTIFKSKARFISIFAIVFLGAAFFAGLRNTPEIMSASIDQYLDKNNYAHLTYIASLGFSEEDIHLLDDIDGIDKIQCGYMFDALMNYHEDQTMGITVYANEEYNEQMINYPDLRKGRYPTKDNECLIDEELYKEKHLNIGDKIDIHNDQGKKTFEIVGLINDVRYVSSMDRGTNSLGDGTNGGFIEILSQDNEYLAMPQKLYDLRDVDVLYNQIFVYVDGAKDYNVFSEEYDDYIENVNTKIKSQLSLQMNHLYEDITSDARKELEKAQKEYDNGYKKYSDAKTLFDSQILDAKIQLTNGKLKLAQKEEEFIKASKKSTGKMSSITKEINNLQKEIDDLQMQLKNQQTQIPDIDSNELPDISMSDLELLKKEINQTINKVLNQLSKTLSQTSQSVDGLLQLTEASLQIEQAKLTIEKQENELTLQELKTNEKLKQTKEQLDKASIQLKQAKDEINKIPKGKVFTLTRHENAGLVSFDANIESISSIANVFPLMFFLVSALVSLTTMTRMVEEQRGQSGILRALGYTKWDVIRQYIIYVILATFFACFIGIYVGIEVFPRIIYFLYNLMLFEVNAPVVILNNFMIALQTVFISVFVTLFVTLFVCISELNAMPSILMRPKAPKIGKRIFLEKITWIWKRLSFNQKVTMRNILRYKKRFFMSIIGIAGCTALIITGFGIKYSVSQVVDLQYKNVLRYDALLRLEDTMSVSEAKKCQENIFQRQEVTNVEYVYNQTISILKNKEDLMGSLIVYQSMENISHFITFTDYQTNKKITLDDEGVVLSQKTAELLGVEANDTMTIDLNDQKYEVKVSAITKNYFMNYVYMSQNYYEDLTDSSLEVNHGFLNMKSTSDSNKATLEAYLNDKDYGHISYITDIGSNFYNQVQSVDMVVVILIVCAGALNFIVLYNLTNINIQERKSEIATIKVLGFRKKEVYDYVFRENVLLSIIGSIFGCFLGFILHRFIIFTVELDVTMFVRSLDPMSYVYAIVMTIGFTIFINLTMRHVLNKIDMVESLKSIE